MSRPNSARASSANLAPKLSTATPGVAIPAAAISGSHAFFDRADDGGHRNPFESMGFTGSIILRAPDPARRQRLLRVVKITMGVVAAIGALAIVRVAVDGTGDSDASAPTSPSSK